MPKLQLNRLSGNALKIIAAVTMLVDHAGMLLFPRVRLLRIIGRISFPIFAYFIAEGCRYTKSKLRYFLTVLLSGAVFQTVYYLATGSDYMNIFITFALSIPAVYLLNALKGELTSTERNVPLTVSLAVMLAVYLAFLVFFTEAVTVSYGLAGVSVPIASSIFMAPRSRAHGSLAGNSEAACPPAFDSRLLQVLCTGAALLALARVNGGVQIYALLALPLLLLYSGERGRLKMKYFFYVFYPAHLVLLQGLALLMK